MPINLMELYQETVEKLRAAELAAAELRGELRLIERLIAQSQQPTVSGEAVGEEIQA